MAHGWDSYYHNLSSDPRPLRTTELEGRFPQQVENFILHDDFTSTVASHGPPATTANFNANCFSNPGLGNTSTDCVYQRYYTESSWQADGQQIEKDYLPQCENGDDFSTDGLLPSGCFPPSFPADLQGIKQDCGMLTSSFLEDYSDVDTGLETDSGETRSSCKFIENSFDQTPKADSTAKHSLTEWLFSHTGSTVFSTESVPNNVAHTNVGLSSSSNVKSTVECSQDELKNPEKSVVSSTEHDLTSNASNVVTTTDSETCKDSNEKEEMDRGKHLDIVSDHKILSIGGEQSAPNAIAPFPNEQQLLNEDLLRKDTEPSFKQEREGSNNVVQVGTKTEDQHNKTQGRQVDPIENITSDEQKCLKLNSIDKEDKSIETDCKDKDIKMGTSQGSDLLGLKNASNELTKCISILENTDDKSVAQDKIDKSTVMVTHGLSGASDKNGIASNHTSPCSHLNSLGETINPCIQNDQTTAVTKRPSSDINLCPGNQLTESTLSSNAKSSTDQQCSGNNEQTMISPVATHSQPTATDADVEEEGLKRKTTVSSVDSSFSGSGVTGTLSIDNSDKNKLGVAETQDLTSQTDGSTTDLHSSLENVYTSKQEIMTLHCTGSAYQRNGVIDQTESTVDCNDLAAACDGNEQSVSNCVESCLELNNSNIILSKEKEVINPPERETPTTNNTPQMLLDESPVNLNPQQPDIDITENARQSFGELDSSSEEQSVFDMLYGEPLSSEDSCDTNKTDPGSSQYKDKSEATTDWHSMEDLKGQAPQLEATREMRNLHPVVILKDLETSKEMNNSYYCEACKHTTNSVKSLIEHHHHSHSVHNFQYCKQRDVYLMRNEQAEDHLRDKIKDSSGPSDSNRRETSRHGYHKCNRCGLVFSKVVIYVRHMRTHTGKTPFRCNKCGVYFAQGSTLHRHKRIPGRCKQVKRPVASSHAATPKTETSEQQDVIQKRLGSNLPDCYVKLVDIAETHLCYLCNKSFSTAEKTKKHVSSVHKTKTVTISPNGEIPTDEDVTSKYKCPLCPRLFKYSYNRARHLRDCVRDTISSYKEKVAGKYLCPLCHATFTLSSNRYRHIKAVCLRQCLNQLAIQRAQSRKNLQPKTRKQTEQKARPKEQEHKKRVHFSGAEPKIGRRYKCNFCPATFSHASGKYKHHKKHDVFKLTGKTVKYTNSALSMSTPATSTSMNNDGQEDTQSLDVKNSCQFCGKCFATSQTLKKHERTHRGERPYRCLECRKGFKRLSHLICHKIVHQKRIQCTVCGKVLPNVGELIQHRTSHHNRGKLQCPDCDQQFQYPVYLLRHLYSHTNRENKAAQLEEGSQQQLLESMEDNSGEHKLQCSLCKEEFEDAQVLRKHCLTHISRSSSHQCPFCKHTFSNRRYLLRHMIKHTGDKAYSCGNCGKQFYRYLYFKLHKKSCCPEPNIDFTTVESGPKTKKPFKCSYCPRAFCKKMRLKSHHDGHKRNSLALCSRCGQYFGLWKLNQHQKGCAGTTGPTSGSHSDKFNEGISQANHNVHKMPLKSKASNMLPFKCSHCTQKFRYRSLLLRHMVTHTGLQPYPCLHCGRRFSSQGTCWQHEAFCHGDSNEGPSDVKSEASTIQTTTEETTPVPQAKGPAEYKCKFCTKVFTKARKLRYHILKHNEVKPYRCKACDSCFSRYDHLKVHQSRCKGKKTRLEVCIPKVSLEDIGMGWQNRFSKEPVKSEETFQCNLCDRSFSSQSKLSRHNTMYHVAKLFTCSDCGYAFSHEKTLKRHRRTIKCRRVSTEANTSLLEPPNSVDNLRKPLHGMRSQIFEKIKPCFNTKYKYVCSYCPRAFRNRWQLDVHTRLHTGEKPYACDYCGQRYIRKDYVQRHYLKCSMKQLNQVLCDQCGGRFSKADFENHRKRCVTSPNTSKSTVCQDQQSNSKSLKKGFSCAYCTSRFVLFSQLQEHFLNAHKPETLAPPVTTASLQHHLSNISNIKEEPLDESCDERRGQDANLACNVETALNTNVKKQYVCPECKKAFGKKSALVAHLRGHTMTYPFNCKICKKGFWNRTHVRNHHRKCRFSLVSERNPSTLVEGPLKAEIDFALVFNEDSTTSDTVVPQTNSSCEDDLNKLPQHSEETLVQSNPSNEKKVPQYQCSECDESFTDGLVLISHLEEHGRQEQEKKRNTCSRCGHVSASPVHLENHMKIHGITQKFSCPECSKVVYSSSALKIHRTCHEENRPFVCKLCNHRFWTKTCLWNHYREEHADHVFSCHLCKSTYPLKTSLQRHYKQCHEEEPKDVESTGLDRASNSTSQDSTPGESDEDDNDGTGDSDSDTAPYFPCHVCGKTFPTSESLEDHQRCHLGEKPHECEVCGKCFFQASQLQQHQRMHNSELQCQVCGRGFVSLFALRKHKHSHGKSRPYRCSKCLLSFAGPSQLAEHMPVHCEENFPCDICNRIFHSKSSRAEHRKSHSKSAVQHLPSAFQHSLAFNKELKYRCGVCGDRFRDPEELSEHGCMAAKERLYSCSDCSKHFLHASHLKKHRTAHHPSISNREYACNKCNNSFSSSQNFLNHLKSHADTAGGSHGFICPVCRQCFASASELWSHFPTHADHVFECKTCKIIFPSRSMLNEHERQHLTSSTEFTCTECHQSFLGNDAFSQHDCSHHQRAAMNEKTTPSAQLPPSTYLEGEEEEVDVTGEEVYNCPACSMQFSSTSSFLEHQNRVHLNEKPFKCELCEKSFSLRRYLKKHQQRHRMKLASQKTSCLMETLVRCTQCPAQFSSAYDLSVHMRMHAEKQVGDYRCDMCYKSFSHWHPLKVHQESHVGEVVYECTECDKAFAFPHLLEEHQHTHAGSSH